MIIKRIEFEDIYNVRVENDQEEGKTQLGVNDWSLMFTSKQDVVNHIALLNGALEFWEYDGQ